MATTLTANINASVNFTFSNALTGITPTVSSAWYYTKALTDGTTAGTANRIYFVQTTIAGGASTTLDLAGSLTDFFGSTITFARINYMWIKLTSDTAATSISVGNAAATQFVNWISSTTATVKIYNDGIFLLGDAGTTSYAVGAGASDFLKILNNDGSNTATLQLCFIGKSA